MKKIAAGLALAVAVSGASAATAATYLPVGPQTNVALSTVTGGGWTLCYQSTMNTFLGSSAEQSLSGCSGDKILLAARSTGSDTLLALAQADRDDVFFDTGINSSTTHNANGTEWYNADDYSWGFAPGGESVSKSQCDTNSGEGRICLHTVNLAGGYRINNIFGLNDSTEYEKLVFTSDGGSATPEPATWALMIGGFGLAGAALRRRKPAVA